MRRTVFGLICLLFSCLPAAADDWLKALMLFDAGRYEEALELAEPFAEDGNLIALEMLYASYTYGYGVAVDPAKALHWALKGAEQGDPSSQDAVGHHYYDGLGVARDEVEAMRWFRLAAEQGHAPSIFSLAIMTTNGWGIEADPVEGWRLVQYAAELGEPDALFMVARVLLRNSSATNASDTALAYLLRAAQLGHRQASALLGVELEDFRADPDYLLKSAFHYQVAVAAGCTDVAEAAKRVSARLSQEEHHTLEYNLELWRREIVVPTDPRDPQPGPGQCLAG